MTQAHGAETIKRWLEEFADVARSDASFDISAGADPGRDYAYLEYHMEDDRHSILLFRVEDGDEGGRVRTYRFDGSAAEVRDRVDALTHGDRRA